MGGHSSVLRHHCRDDDDSGDRSQDHEDGVGAGCEGVSDVHMPERNIEGCDGGLDPDLYSVVRRETLTI